VHSCDTQYGTEDRIYFLSDHHNSGVDYLKVENHVFPANFDDLDNKSEYRFSCSCSLFVIQTAVVAYVWKCVSIWWTIQLAKQVK